jgi:hypothetical protein
MSQTTTAATPPSRLTEAATFTDKGRRTPPASSADRAIKQRRVLEILDAKGQDSLLLTSHTALAWYLDGSRVHISLAGDPIAALLVDRDGDHLVTFNNEAGRIAAEELPVGVALHTVPWYGNLHEAAAAVGHSSGGGAGNPLAEALVATELRAARQQLLPGESARYARLSAELAGIMTDVLNWYPPWPPAWLERARSPWYSCATAAPGATSATPWPRTHPSAAAPWPWCAPAGTAWLRTSPAG